MPPAFSLAHLTAITLSPPELIHLAARTGYQMVGLRMIRVTDTSPGYPLMRDGAMLTATKAALAATGIAVLDIEFVRITPVIDIAALEPFLATGAELGARHIVTASYDPDLGRMTDRLAAIASMARGYGLATVLEFFPWTNVPDLATARTVAAATGRDDVGILVDTLHFNRSASDLADLIAIPPHRLPFLHLCDAPVHPPYSTDDLFHAGRAERLPPGDGEIDLPAIIEAMPPGIPIALEVPMTAAMAADGVEAVVRSVRTAALRFFPRARQPGQPVDSQAVGAKSRTDF